MFVFRNIWCALFSFALLPTHSYGLLFSTYAQFLIKAACAYQRLRNVNFSENLAHVLNE